MKRKDRKTWHVDVRENDQNQGDPPASIGFDVKRDAIAYMMEMIRKGWDVSFEVIK